MILHRHFLLQCNTKIICIWSNPSEEDISAPLKIQLFMVCLILLYIFSNIYWHFMVVMHAIMINKNHNVGNFVWHDHSDVYCFFVGQINIYLLTYLMPYLLLTDLLNVLADRGRHVSRETVATPAEHISASRHITANVCLYHYEQ